MSRLTLIYSTAFCVRPKMRYAWLFQSARKQPSCVKLSLKLSTPEVSQDDFKVLRSVARRLASRSFSNARFSSVADSGLRTGTAQTANACTDFYTCESINFGALQHHAFIFAAAQLYARCHESAERHRTPRRRATLFTGRLRSRHVCRRRIREATMDGACAKRRRVRRGL